jgi:hypothetical protein
MLNLHFAESQGTKELDLQPDTMKRLKVDEAPTVDYDQDYGKIKFTVDASTSQTADNEKENERLIGILEVTDKNAPLPPHKQMQIINQVIQNSGVDDPEKIQFTDDEIAMAEQNYLNPPAPEPTAPIASVEQGVPMPPEAQMPMSQNMSVGPVQPQQSTQGLSDDEMQTVAAMQERGVPDEDIATVVTMLRNGMGDEEIAQVLMGGN